MKISIPSIFAVAILFLAWRAPAQVLEQTFSDTLAGFRISTPNQHWRLEPRGIDPGDLKLTMRFEFPLYQFVPNVTVRVTEVPQNSEKASDLLEEALRQFPASFEVLRKKPISHLGQKGFELLLKEKDTGLLFHQWFFPAKGKTFLITGTAKEAAFPRIEGDFLKILQSFEII